MKTIIRKFLMPLSLSAVLLTPAFSNASISADDDSLISFLNNNDSIPEANRALWVKEAQRKFGSSAYSSYNKEAMNAAKTFINQALILELEPRTIIKSAHQVFFDVSRWVPEPMARGYQMLVLQGRDPKVPIWIMVDNFPTYYQEDIAMEMLDWWQNALNDRTLPPTERERIKKSIIGTRQLVRPIMLDRLLLADKLEVTCATSCRPEEAQTLEKIDQEIQTLLQGVANDERAYDTSYSYCERAQILASELHKDITCTPNAKALAEQKRIEEEMKAESDSNKPKRPRHGWRKRIIKTESVAATINMETGEAIKPVEKKLGEKLSAKMNKSIQKWLGTPYVWGGKTTNGVDCSGFTSALYNEAFGFDLPSPARVQADYGRAVRLSKLKEGDLILFDTLQKGYISHVAVYVGDGKFVHASSSKGVSYAKMTDSYFKNSLRGARRIINEDNL